MEKVINPLHSSVVFLMQTSHLILTANQVTGFYMKFNTAEMKEMFVFSDNLTCVVFLLLPF